MELSQLDEKTRKIIERFVEQLKPALADNLKSVILYGSRVSGGHSSRHSDINLLLVLAKADITGLKSIAHIKPKFKFNKIAPLVLSKEHLENSTDTFPMEFLDMQDNYILLWGEDCLKDLKIDLANLRHQCEWELKSKLIQLQQFYIHSRGNPAALSNFLIQGLPSFMLVFKNILRLKGIIEDNKDKILAKISGEFNLSPDIFNQLWQARLGNFKLTNPEETFARFLSNLQEFSQKVDGLKI